MRKGQIVNESLFDFRAHSNKFDTVSAAEIIKKKYRPSIGLGSLMDMIDDIKKMDFKNWKSEFADFFNTDDPLELFNDINRIAQKIEYE